jgi:hypothetical protein
MARISAMLKKPYRRLASQKGHPREIALGFALGIFIGMSPYFLCHTVAALLLATAFGWNRVSAAVGVFITNPVTAPFLYGLTYQVGLRLAGPAMAVPFPREFTVDTFLWLLQSAPRLAWVMTIGGAVVGLPMAAGGYCLALWTVRRYRERRRKATASPKIGASPLLRRPTSPRFCRPAASAPCPAPRSASPGRRKT